MRSLPSTWILLAGTVLVGAAAGALQLAGVPVAVAWLLGGLAVAVAGWRLVRMVRELRSGSWGIDVLAVLAVGSTVVIGEWWAAWVITLMMTGGDALEDFAFRRAHREISALLERVPRRALRLSATGATEDVAVDDLMPGDEVLVRPGDLVPVDGVLIDSRATVDLSSMTGESMPEVIVAGNPVVSGAIATSEPMRIRCTNRASQSEYQRIVAAVGSAAQSRSRFVRLSDRIAVPFTVVALLIAGAAWLSSGQFLRFAEVLVVATPCPLLIAAPAAFVAGMGRAARLGVVLKTTEALERLAAARSAAFDKTGTLTNGTPSVDHLVAASGVGEERLLALVSAAESLSSHALAAPIVAEAARRDIQLPPLTHVAEVPGSGIRAEVDGKALRVGSARFTGSPSLPATSGAVEVTASLGNAYLGAVVLRDPVRPDAPETITALRRAGVERIVMLTGDDEATAAMVAAEAGIAELHSRLEPAEKAALVGSISPRPVLMVGDGINDILVLASADVGIAMSRAGLGAVGESADAVVVSDRLGAIVDARRVATRTRRIARQSVWFGVIASVALMIVATTGVLPPIVGALAQEAIDVLTILNALRATR